MAAGWKKSIKFRRASCRSAQMLYMTTALILLSFAFKWDISQDLKCLISRERLLVWPMSFSSFTYYAEVFDHSQVQRVKKDCLQAPPLPGFYTSGMFSLVKKHLSFSLSH